MLNSDALSAWTTGKRRQDGQKMLTCFQQQFVITTQPLDPKISSFQCTFSPAPGGKGATEPEVSATAWHLQNACRSEEDVSKSFILKTQKLFDVLESLGP